MTTKPKPPILPRNPRDPSGTDPLEGKARRDFNRRYRKIRQVFLDLLETLPKAPAQSALVVNRRYTYRIDGAMLSVLLDRASQLVDDLLLEGGLTDLWFFRAYVGVAYTRGTIQEFANLARQSETYITSRGDRAANLLSSDAYLRRMQLLAAREFEEMKGLSGETTANMSRILTDGIGRGKNPREVAAELRDQANIEARRAHRIARTEIPMALRRARMDEADEAEDDLGLRSMQMHQSAFSPTTRPSHAARHGNLYTTEQQRDWWSRDGNGINCKCSTVTVLVDNQGKPLVPEIQKRARETKVKMLERIKEDEE